MLYSMVGQDPIRKAGVQLSVPQKQYPNPGLKLGETWVGEVSSWLVPGLACRSCQEPRFRLPWELATYFPTPWGRHCQTWVALGEAIERC